MDFSIDTSKINMGAPIKPIQPANLPIKDTSEFPSKQAEKLQQHLLELDKQGKLKEEFLKRYKDNLGDKNSFARFCLDNWEEKKDTFINWTGIEVYKDKHTIIDTGIKMNQISYGSHKCMLWKCNKCSHEWTAEINLVYKLSTMCPCCNENTFLSGKNDFQTWCDNNGEIGKRLLNEFQCKDENNETVNPSEISQNSIKKYLWECSECHYNWYTTIYTRTKFNAGCQHVQVIH